MSKLEYQELEPNEIERAIIDWDIPTLKKGIIDQNLLFRLGYNEKEINHMQKIFFGISISNPSQMTYFEKAVYANDKKAVENYYHYMNKNKSVMESFGYTPDDLKNIHYVHILGNERILTSTTDNFEIYTRLFHLQKNKNRMAEMYILKYLEEEDEAKLIYKQEAINELVRIYKEEVYLPERKDDIKRLISLYPEILTYSQLARSIDIELLYRDKSDEKRYEKIYEKGFIYEKKLKECRQIAEASELSDDEKERIEEERKKYTLEDKAKYLYVIAASKCNENKLDYFKDNKLEQLTNVTYMKDFLELSKSLLRLSLESSKKEKYSDILHTMAEKAKGEKAGANYGFLLYLNRVFGDEYGINRAKLEEQYHNADRNIEPFKCNGYGTYLYALAQDYIRENNTLEGFAYKADFLCLKRKFYGYYCKHIELHLMKDPMDCGTIRGRIDFIHQCISTGERKLYKEEGNDKAGKNKAGSMPRFLCFFPEQDAELSVKYEAVLQRDLERSKKSDITGDRLSELELSLLPDASQLLSVNSEEILNEICCYVWKKIQYNFDQSKDQWLILAKIYEGYMNAYKLLAEKEGEPENKTKLEEAQLKWAKKAASALRIRAELNFVYHDSNDLYLFYLRQAKSANAKEKSEWMKAAFELYLEMAYKVGNDTDRVGKHFAGFGTYLRKSDNVFKLFIKEDKSIANRYVEELAILYFQYRQYRYLRLAFEITKMSGEYELYLRKFLKALVQWEMVQLISNIRYLLQEGEYDIAQLFYNYCVEHINHIPAVLNLTHELIEGLAVKKSVIYRNALNLLTIYPNVHKTYLIVKGADESLMSDHIKALEFILHYYTATKELIGELDCSSISYALYLQYQQLYFRTRREEYLEKMFDAIEQSTKEEENLSRNYKVITLCYRHDSLKKDVGSVIEKMNLSAELADKLKGYQLRLERLKNEYGEKNREAFQELCELTLLYSYKNINNIKGFIKKYILSNKIEMKEVLRDYLMSFDMIGKAWLQLYFEENGEITKDQSFADNVMYFPSVDHVSQALAKCKRSNISVLNFDILKRCVYDLKGSDDLYTALVKEYLKKDDLYRNEDLDLLHNFFALIAKEEGLSLYNVIDAINKESQYKNPQCTELLEKLFEVTTDINYLPALARQHAKAGSYEEAISCYGEVLEYADNTNLAEQYAYIKIHRSAISLLALANSNEKIKVSTMEDIKARQVYEVLAYLSSKYPDEVTKVMAAMEEEERNLLLYIHQLVSFEQCKSDKNKKNPNSDLSIDAEEENQEGELLTTLLKLKDTRHLSYLLPNLYQTSNDFDFKYKLAKHNDRKIQSVLKEANNKPILVLNEQKMKKGQKLMLMDYSNQALNVYAVSREESKDTRLLQELINQYDNNEEDKPISELFLQLEKESFNKNRKDCLLQILTNQSYTPEEIEMDAELQRRLQLAKAELGYLIHLEEFETDDYVTGMCMLHEGILCLGSNKSDCLDLLEKIREQYCVILEHIPEKPFQTIVKLFPAIASDIHKINELFRHWNNPKNVFLREMQVIIGCLQSFEESTNPLNEIGLLEAAMDRFTSLGRDMVGIDKRLISSITYKWRSWLYTELVQIVSRETISDKKYFIDRIESKNSLEDFYQKVINDSKNINLYGPKGIGVSSLIRQCYQEYYERAIDGGNILLTLDSKEIRKEKLTEDFNQKLYNQIHQAIKKIIDLNYLWGESLLEHMKSSDGSLNYLDGIRQQKEIRKVHLFLDHYEEFHDEAKLEMDKILLRLVNKGIHLVIGSEPVLQVEFVAFSNIELMGFTETETRNYISSRLNYQEEKLQTIPKKEVYKLTWGIPTLLCSMVGYILKSDTFNIEHGKIFLMSEAKELFEHWEPIWNKKLYREDNAAYRSYISVKNGLPDQGSDMVDAKIEAANVKIKAEVKAEVKDEMTAEMEGKIEAAKVEINNRVDTVEAKFHDIINCFGKEEYIRKYNLESKDKINLKEYHDSIPWNEEAEVDMEEFGMSEDIWEQIKREEDVYQYIKYGEAFRRFTHGIRQPNYDYSVFALNYCLAFELISNRMLKGFFMRKIPEHDVTDISECRNAGITKLKESPETMTYTVGAYKNFLYDYQGEYKAEIRMLSFDFYKYRDAYKEAKNIRNDVAHVGKIIYKDRFSRFLSLLFGDSKNPVGQPSVFEGICRLAGTK